MRRALKRAEKVDPLTRSERGMFKECEQDIAAGKDSFYKVAYALAEIRDKRYYREEFATFEEYCSKRWDFTRQYASNLITAVAVAQQLSTSVDKGPGKRVVMPESEWQVRPLKALPPPKRKEAWHRAVESAGGNVPNHSQVRAAVRELGTTLTNRKGSESSIVRRAIGLLKTVSNPTKNIKAAIDLLSTEIDSGFGTIQSDD